MTQHLHSAAVLVHKCGSAGAQVNAPVAKKCGLALARPVGVSLYYLYSLFGRTPYKAFSDNNKRSFL
jgi:hypothetical protein